MPQFENILRMTELEGVNAMLATIGESPIAQADLDTPTSNDVTMAINIFRDVQREVLSMKWKFNHELEYAVNATIDTDPALTAGTDDQKFEVPANLLRFDASIRADQQGSKYLDVAIKPPTNAASTITGLIFYDRKNNRDYFDTAERTVIYIDPVWGVDFEDMPQTARDYIRIRASRQFQARLVGSRELESLSATDELLAFKSLREDQGATETLTMLDNSDVSAALGGRSRGARSRLNIV